MSQITFRFLAMVEDKMNTNLRLECMLLVNKQFVTELITISTPIFSEKFSS